MVGVDVKEDRVTELSYVLYLPRIRNKDWADIGAPAPTDIVVKHPDLPGLEIHILKNTVIRDKKGNIYSGRATWDKAGKTSAGTTTTTQTVNYLTGLGIDERFSRTDSSGTQSYLTDALGSTLALADSAGTLQTNYSYDPFGNTTVTGTTNPNAFQYTGRENDGTGLYYYRARYYSPQWQRFLSEDPIGLAGGLNSYTYVGNNPINHTDPLGLIADCISYTLGVSRREWQEIDETILAQFSLPVPIPTGWGVGPGGPRQPPIGPEIQFDLWEVEYTLAAQRVYLHTQLIQHMQAFCTETREGECGKTETFRSSFKMDKTLDSTRTLIDERLDWRHRLIRLLGRGGF